MQCKQRTPVDPKLLELAEEGSSLHSLLLAQLGSHSHSKQRTRMNAEKTPRTSGEPYRLRCWIFEYLDCYQLPDQQIVRMLLSEY